MSVEDETVREYRQKMRRSFDALNEEASKGRQNRRPYDSLNVGDENKREMRNFFSALNAGKLDDMLRAVSPNVIDHSTPAGARAGIEGVRDWFAMLHNGFPDLHADVADMAIDGDKVVAHVRFTGTHTGDFGDVAATNKQLTLNSTETMRFEGGKHVERWSDLDMPAIIQQVGAGTSA
ncbi:MAG: ester cyclase [Chloroflexota bacterium]|nr:ester cyclase [Chloroflexota bacterium]MDQ5866200.1 ester cyclase [Chloroflexota bacterium]